MTLALPRRPELLAPAGSLAMVQTAFAFGADAIYAGQPRYSLRVRNNEFGSLDKLTEAIRYSHALSKKFFLVSNIFPHQSKLKTYLHDMAPVIALGPDALIMSDPGLISLVREHFPHQVIHLSVQANTVNSASVKFWQKVGVSRIILSRELSLEEIASIREACPDMELEVFVHGALCMAYSGRCLLSGYLNQRDANQGACTNACRWDYRVLGEASAEAAATPAPATGTAPISAGGTTRPVLNYVVEEPLRRAGEYNPIEEDEHGTYIFNSKDLRAIEHIARLTEIGVDSFKIEGRTKSVYYVARATQAYRRAIDDAVAGRGFDPALLADLESLANRGYTDGFLQRHHDSDYQNYLRGFSESRRSRLVGQIVAFDREQQRVEVEVKNRFTVGSRCEIVHPAGNQEMVVEAMYSLTGEAIDLAPGSGHRVFLPLPATTVGGFVAAFV